MGERFFFEFTYAAAADNLECVVFPHFLARLFFAVDLDLSRIKFFAKQKLVTACFHDGSMENVFAARCLHFQLYGAFKSFQRVYESSDNELSDRLFVF
jgi:hypothetical protein